MIRTRLIHWLARHLLNPITEDDLFKGKGRDWYFQGKVLPPETVSKLKQDAKIFHDSLLWNILKNESKYRANEIIYEKSTKIDDILFGKALLFEIDVLEKKINEIAN